MRKGKTLCRAGVFLLTACLAVGGLAVQNKPFEDCTVVSAAVYGGTTTGGLDYEIDTVKREVVVYGMNPDATGIVIPGTIEGYPVTSIGEEAFVNFRSLKTISIPSTVTSIGKRAFDHCAALKSITIPNGVTSLPEKLFNGCTSLSSVSLPSTVTSIGDYAFCSCSSLASLRIPNRVTSIGDYAFYGCTFMPLITIPNGVTKIGMSAFADCDGLTVIQIPASVTSIGADAFYGTQWLADRQSENPLVIVNHLLLLGEGAKGSVVIPDGVTTICEAAFCSCTKLTSITIPKSVTAIAAKAFSDCTTLSNVTYKGSPAEWTKIAIDADNASLTNATIRFAKGSAAIITVQPKSTTTLYGRIATFTVNALGNGLVYQWQYSRNNGASWGNLTGATSKTYSVTANTARNGFRYRCRITDESGRKLFSQQAKLTTKTVTTIQQQPNSVAAIRNTTATFKVRATGDGLVYQWQYSVNNGASWGNLTGATTNTYSVKAVNARNGYCYRCRITDRYGKRVFTKRAVLFVLPAATIVTQPKSVTTEVGETATFTVGANGLGLTYQWQFSRNGGTSWGNLSCTANSYSVLALDARNGWCYRCIVKDEAGNSATSATAKLTVT